MLRHHCAGLAIKLCSALHWGCLSATKDVTPLIHNLLGWTAQMSPQCGHVVPPSERKSSGLAANPGGNERLCTCGLSNVGHSEPPSLFQVAFHGKYTILPKLLGHLPEHLNSNVLITPVATGISPYHRSRVRARPSCAGPHRWTLGEWPTIPINTLRNCFPAESRLLSLQRVKWPCIKVHALPAGGHERRRHSMTSDNVVDVRVRFCLCTRFWALSLTLSAEIIIEDFLTHLND